MNIENDLEEVFNTQVIFHALIRNIEFVPQKYVKFCVSRPQRLVYTANVDKPVIWAIVFTNFLFS